MLDPVAVALPPLKIEEPTVAMFFLVNNGPFAGDDGRAVTLRQIKDRLARELRVNVALRVEDLGRPDGVKVSGRGELHLAILIEEMRREGMELCVSRPEVITHRDAQGKLLEPIEQLIIDVPDEYQGTSCRSSACARVSWWACMPAAPAWCVWSSASPHVASSVTAATFSPRRAGWA